ncbi:hypothetical protein KC363_g4304 [Hortaea werneckii]|uniref:F-box domain-containing protein n=1 Tax=Hortaea werneckii TaxID=91943 RepID=A0A3M7FZ93_HORWE|nr:hypothetical protein KC361_g6839 [Hortaea werneckii]KAI7190641.1 hypothetical protein KC363_g4304 [Hortaea werneckii]KAI7508002.1 hypothetical protein KC347_g6496 [Hortaea werneckii]RMY94160.1 hypothetical protein D0861_01463 [Hortaea werneckii]
MALRSERNTSPLLFRLPPELRNRIYELLLLPDTNDQCPYSISKQRLSPAILNVNRQIHSESAGIFFQNNIFQFSDPTICLRWLRTVPLKYREMITEIRYDCSESCLDPRSWRRAFLDLPGMDEDQKLLTLKSRLAEQGTLLQYDVLKAGVRINGVLVWTHDPLSEAREAVQRGALVGRVMFV